jgi:hypothetical protein
MERRTHLGTRKKSLTAEEEKWRKVRDLLTWVLFVERALRALRDWIKEW